MALEINDTSLGITIKKAYIRIDYFTVNPAQPFEEKDAEGNIVSSEKRYNVNLFLQYLNSDKEWVYRREVVSVNDLKEDQLNFDTYYTKLKEFEKFSEAKDI